MFMIISQPILFTEITFPEFLFFYQAYFFPRRGSVLPSTHIAHVSSSRTLPISSLIQIDCTAISSGQTASL